VTALGVTAAGCAVGVTVLTASVVLTVAVVTCVVLPAAWLLLVDVVQPATNKEATTSKRTTIAVIDFSCIIGHLRK
jgi:hypothetical protein